MNTKTDAAKLNIAARRSETRKFRRRNRNSIRSAKFYRAHKWMRTGRVILWSTKGSPSCATLGESFAQKAFTAAIQESSKRLYHERLLCKAGSTKAALAVGVFVNRYLEMDSRAFFQWTEAEEGRSSTRVGLSCSQNTEIDFKARRERATAPGDSVKIPSPRKARREGSTQIFSSLSFLKCRFTGDKS